MRDIMSFDSGKKSEEETGLKIITVSGDSLAQILIKAFYPVISLPFLRGEILSLSQVKLVD